MNDRVYTVVYMIVLCAIATVLMTGAKLLLAPRIAQNETLRENRLILFGLGLLGNQTEAKEIAESYRQQVKTQKQGNQTLYYGYGRDGALKSIGMPFEGMGFWGPIRGLLSVTPDGKQIAGIVFIDHQETPGLGGRINEPWFMKQFIGKDVAEPDGNGAYLEFIPEGTAATGPRQVNAISGATRTSDSLNKILNGALKDVHATLAESKGGNP